ncbi:MAG: hypothetical protein DDT18_00168 [Actinobacteria bacterium]|nr:hypothetical protein [Bacillota bacterium]MBT9169833.1 hypothetical protein [Actinomycetota bacterium]
MGKIFIVKDIDGSGEIVPKNSDRRNCSITCGKLLAQVPQNPPEKSQFYARFPALGGHFRHHF